jgi:hypothetical protein
MMGRQGVAPRPVKPPKQNGIWWVQVARPRLVEALRGNFHTWQEPRLEWELIRVDHGMIHRWGYEPGCDLFEEKPECEIGSIFGALAVAVALGPKVEPPR